MQRSSWPLATFGDLLVVRDLYGRVRLAVSDSTHANPVAKNWLKELATDLQASLGLRSHAADDAVIAIDLHLMRTSKKGALEISPGVFWVDRLVTGHGWWTVGAEKVSASAKLFTLYSVKGGVGQSTTAAVLSRHLARRGESVLLVDMDLESPGLSGMLDADRQPRYGVTDWFVEDLVGQGDEVLEHLAASPSWDSECDGEIRVVPAHGREPGPYLAKLGRVQMDTTSPWSNRVRSLVRLLDNRYKPTVIIFESRSGLHGIAAATVTDLAAQVLLFGVDSSSTWTGYDILFRHWNEHRLATSIRENLSMVSALTPEVHGQTYLDGFRESSWNLFREHLYDDLLPDDGLAKDRFSFDLTEDGAPHDPLPIHWNRGLGAGSSLSGLPDAPVRSAYIEFLRRFDSLYLSG